MSECNIDHWCDPDRPGYLRRDAILSGKELRRAIELKLRRWDGKSLELVHTSPDPIRQAVKNEVPAHLKLELQDAEAAEQHAVEIKNMAAERYSDAETALRKFWDANGPTLSERGSKKRAELQAAMETAEADFESAHTLLSEAISKRVTVANRVNEWKRVELIVRREAAAQAEKATQAKTPPTLADRLRNLGQKLTT